MEGSGDNKQKEIDLMEHFCSNKKIIDNENYYNNIINSVIETLNRILLVEKKECIKYISKEQFIDFVKCIIEKYVAQYNNMFAKNFNVPLSINPITIKGSKMITTVFIEDEKVFDIIFYGDRRISVLGQSCYVDINIIFYPYALLKQYNSFEEKLCNYIKLISLLKPDNYESLIKTLQETLETFFLIEEDDKSEFGYRVLSTHDLDIRKWGEQEPSLQTVMKHYDKNEIEDAIKDLRELISDKNIKFKTFKDKQSKLVNVEITGVYNRFSQIIHYLDKDEKIDNKQYEKMIESLNGMIKELKSIINDGDKKKEKLTKDEIKIWFDLGLSIYRLYIMSDNANKNQSNEKEAVNDIGDEDLPF